MRTTIMTAALVAGSLFVATSAFAQSTSFQPSYDNSGNGIVSLTGAWRNTAEYPNNASERGGSSSGGVALFTFGGGSVGFLPADSGTTALSNDAGSPSPLPPVCDRRHKKNCLR